MEDFCKTSKYYNTMHIEFLVSHLKYILHIFSYAYKKWITIYLLNTIKKERMPTRIACEKYENLSKEKRKRKWQYSLERYKNFPTWKPKVSCVYKKVLQNMCKCFKEEPSKPLLKCFSLILILPQFLLAIKKVLP